jgi:hypothetical protein
VGAKKAINQAATADKTDALTQLAAEWSDITARPANLLVEHQRCQRYWFLLNKVFFNGL